MSGADDPAVFVDWLDQIGLGRHAEMFAENCRNEDGTVCGARFVVRLPIEI